MRQFLLKGLFFLLSTGIAYAQQDAQFSYFMNNTLYYNPGFAGVEGVTKINLLHRSQWAFYESSFDEGGAPSTQVFSVSTPVYKFKSGFGAHIVRDQLGPMNNMEMQVSYAYHLGIKNSKLTLGIRSGFFSQTSNFDIYRATQPDDPLLADKTGSESQIRPDMAVGIYFRHEKYYVGASFNHILRSSFDFGFNDLRNAMANHMFFTGGNYYPINNQTMLHTSVLFQTDLKQYNITLGTIMTYKEQVWGGITLRQSEDIGAMFGYNFLKDKSLSFGYSFGYIVKDQAAKEPTSHEVIMSYQLPPVVDVPKKKQRTPRFGR